MESSPPRLPLAPLEAADKPEKKATIPVAVNWMWAFIYPREGVENGPRKQTSIEINDRDVMEVAVH